MNYFDSNSKVSNPFFNITDLPPFENVITFSCYTSETRRKTWELALTELHEVVVFLSQILCLRKDRAKWSFIVQAAADMMVEDLRAAFKELVTESDWMDAATQVRRPPIRPYARSLSQSQIGWTLLHRSDSLQSDRMQGACYRVWLDGTCYTGQKATHHTVFRETALSQSQTESTLLYRSEGHQSDVPYKGLVTRSDWMDAVTKARRPPVRQYRVRLDGRCYTGQKTCQAVCKELVIWSYWMDAAT